MIQEMTTDFTPSQLPMVSGEVQCMRAKAAFASNGDWTFTGYLHDYSTFTGDNYAFAFAFNFTNNGSAQAYMVTGALGSSLTRTPESVSFGVHGNDPWVAQNWRQAFPSGGFFRLHTSDDLAGAIGDLGDDIKNVAVAIGTLFEHGSDCPINPDTGEPECPYPGDDGGDGG
jgi:hypothetical protein